MMVDTGTSKSVGALLEKMGATDTDYRFMAINDLINELQSDSLRLDSQSEKRVVGLVLRLLRDPSGEVQSLAVKSLGPLTSRVKDQQVVSIVKDLVGTMDKSGNEQLRGICSIGLKTVVNALPSVLDSAIVQSAIKEALDPLLHMVLSHSDDNVRVEACEVLAEMINHFGSQLSNHHMDLLDCMLSSLNCPQNALRKRAIQALGGLAWSVPQKHFASIIAYLLTRLENAPIFSSKRPTRNQEQIAAFITESPLLQRPHLAAQIKQPANTELVKTLLQCLNTVSRHVLRVPQYTLPVLETLASILQPSGSGSSEMDDIHELAIQTLETLIRRCPRAVLPMLPELICLLCERLQYDPNYDYSVNDTEMDQIAIDNGDGDLDESEEDEADDYSDDEDSSWKVRRAAARALEAIIIAYPEMTSDFYTNIGPLLIRRFEEHEEPVRLTIFSCLGTLLRQTRLLSVSVQSNYSTLCLLANPMRRHSEGFPRAVIASDPRSESYVSELQAQLEDPTSAQYRLLNLLPGLCQAIHKQAALFSRKKSRNVSAPGRGAPGAQHAAFMLYRDVALALPGHLGQYLDDILGLIHTRSKDPSTNNTVKMDMVNLVALLLGTHLTKFFETKLDLLVELAVWAVNDHFYRVALEGLELVQLLSTKLRHLDGEKYAMTLFVPLFNQLQANDRDLELKEKAIASAAVFIGQIGDLLSSNLNSCLDVICKRLMNELTRLSAVRAIHIIAVSPLKLPLDNFLPSASDTIATFLSKSDRILRLSTLRCLYTIWLKHPQLVGPNCLQVVLSLIPKLLISEQDLQTAQLAIHLVALLLESGGPLSEQVSQFITSNVFLEPLIGLAHSPLLRGQALEAMLRLMRAVGQRSSRNEKEHMVTTLFLVRLLGPLNGSGLLAGNTVPASSQGSLHKDALPSLAQCVAELLGELPLETPSNLNVVPGSVPSLNVAVDRLLIAVKNPSSSSTQTYLNLLILGELGRKLDLSNRADLRELLITCLSSSQSHTAAPNRPATSGTMNSTEEVKPAAALSLGRLVVGSPETLLPFLVGRISAAAGVSSASGTVSTNQHQLYHLLQALREVLLNLAGVGTNNTLRTHLDSIWSLLIINAGLPEEGTRNVVAECLGRLILVSPRQLMDRLRQQLNSPEASVSPLIRCTLVTAVKFVLIVTDIDIGSQTQATGLCRQESLDWTVGSVASCSSRPNSITSTSAATLAELETVLRSDHPPPLLDFLSRLADPDLLVRRAALVALNTAAHHRPSLIRPLLNMPLGQGGNSTLLTLLYGETVIRKELIREVEMGPFKHQEDDGLDLRKCAFECMSTLLDSCLDKLTMAQFLEPLIDGLKDHTDIKLLCYQILQRIAHIRPLEIAAKMEALAAPLKGVLLSKPKEDSVKQEMEKMQELSRCAISVIVSFKSIDDIDKNRFYLDLLHTIEADPTLKPLYIQTLSNETASTSGSSSKRVHPGLLTNRG
ncbi:unnamed protein product [Calicophoron daubneyi]|uniref:TATA-binding protein interacting (TIP20) domain-containing protein n=1 Tax=Calicophoron daubneyi TaxID=300641 RepID=A0AAV2SW70_CALDB